MEDLIKIEYDNNGKYNFHKILTTSLILDLIYKFLEQKDIKLLSLCNKKLYHFYCGQIKKLSIKNFDINSILEKFFNLFKKYENVNELDLSENKYLIDFPFLDKLENIEKLNVSDTYISDISFLEKNNNIKELILRKCENIGDFKPLFNLNKLESLILSYTNISDISFLENNKNIKVLGLYKAKNISDFKRIKFEI